jgi:hypothetical protein
MRFGKAVSISTDSCFAARKAVIKEAFQGFEHLSCHFGDLSHKFRLDHRCFERPELQGPVVASLSVSRRLTSIMQMYPLLTATYPGTARHEFESKVVDHLRNWLTQQLERPETAILGYEELIVTWDGLVHRYAQARFM